MRRGVAFIFNPETTMRFSFIRQALPSASPWLAAGLIATSTAPNALASVVNGEKPGLWPRTMDAGLVDLDLNVTGVPLPLAQNWGPILVDVHIGLSTSLATTGQATIYPANQDSLPNALNGGFPQQSWPPQQGDMFFVDSFFDVFFDITVTDVDPGVDIPGMADGAALIFANNGPAHMASNYGVQADLSLPHYGLVPPPEANPYIGHFKIEIPLGADLNGNGENDEIGFTVVTHTVGAENRTWIEGPNGTIYDTFDSTAVLEGFIRDESVDPPFTITLTGPTTASGGPFIPEPGAYSLIAGLVLAVFAIWRRRC